MHKYSVEVSRYVITYYKDTTVDPDTGEEKVVHKKSFTKLANLSNTVDFDNFIEETRWINSEIVDILDKVWKALPGKHVYLSKSTSHATLDIKLSNHGFPKTIYRVVYKHYRNDLDDCDNKKSENVEDKKLKAYPSPVPISDEERALLDELTNVGKEFRKEIDHLKNDGLLSIRESRRFVSYFASITSSIRGLFLTDDNGSSLDRFKKVHDELQNALKDVETIDTNLPLVYACHSDSIISIVNNMHTLIWDADALGQLKDRYNLAPIAIPTVDYCGDYIFHMINQHLSNN